jgi:hypothetical protein
MYAVFYNTFLILHLVVKGRKTRDLGLMSFVLKHSEQKEKKKRNKQVLLILFFVYCAFRTAWFLFLSLQTILSKSFYFFSLSTTKKKHCTKEMFSYGGVQSEGRRQEAPIHLIQQFFHSSFLVTVSKTLDKTDVLLL